MNIIPNVSVVQKIHDPRSYADDRGPHVATVQRNTEIQCPCDGRDPDASVVHIRDANHNSFDDRGPAVATVPTTGETPAPGDGRDAQLRRPTGLPATPSGEASAVEPPSSTARNVGGTQGRADGRGPKLRRSIQPTPTPNDPASTAERASSTVQKPYDAPGGADGRGPLLVSHRVALAAATLDDVEALRVAEENRLRSLTGRWVDDAGEVHGLGLAGSPEAEWLAGFVARLVELEKEATRQLERAVRAHPLAPWLTHPDRRGVGAKQLGRLLAAVGDPYWNGLHGRPRLVSELWSYCGYGDARRQRRRRGEQSSWSDEARKRAYLVATSCVKQTGPYRAVYDAARERYADATHAEPCARCGPSGHPAPAGSALNPGHRHARGLRAVAKEVLRDLWLEARRLHETTEEDDR